MKLKRVSPGWALIVACWTIQGVGDAGWLPWQLPERLDRLAAIALGAVTCACLVTRVLQGRYYYRVLQEGRKIERRKIEMEAQLVAMRQGMAHR